MINTQSKKLKLTVTKIKSSLFSYNKKIKKIRLDKERFDSQEEKRSFLSKKETSIESAKSKITSPLKKVSSAILSGPKSIFDKIMDFLGTIFLGLLVNNLPIIISKLKKFFGNNPWILNTIKFTIDIIGKGLNAIIWSIQNFPKLAGGTYDVIKSARKNISTEIDKLGRLYDGVEYGIESLSKSWKSFFNPPRPQSSGPIPPTSPSQSPSATQQSPPPTSTPLAPFTLPTTASPSSQNPYGFAKGGTVSQARKTAAGTATQPSATKTTTPFAKPGGSAKGKKANQAVNYFEFFRKNTLVEEENTKLSDENNNKFKEVLKKFNELKILKTKVKDEEGGAGGGGGGDGPEGFGGQFTGSAADIPPEGKALLDAIAGAEAPGYNSRYPSKTFSNGYKDHPRISEPTPDGRTSDAAGRYQFLSTTWDRYKPAKAFTPENQDIAAWKLAVAAYGKGQNGIVKDLQKDPMIVAQGLTGQWPSLPGGSQENVHTRGFLKRYQSALKKYKSLDVKPTSGSFKYVLPQGNPQFTSGFRTTDRPNHRGIDIGVDANSPVTAFESGTIVHIEPKFGDWGDAIYVQHADKTKVVYGHVIVAPGLRKGSYINQGQVIAKVKYWPPNTVGSGNYDNTHLHLERIVNGAYVNPARYVNSVFDLRKNQVQKTQVSTSNKIDNKTSKPIIGSVPKGGFEFAARDGNRYMVQDLPGMGIVFVKKTNAGLVPDIIKIDAKNKWLIDDYNKSLELMQIQQQIKPQPQAFFPTTAKNFDVASIKSSKPRDVVYINSIQPYIVNNTEVVAYAVKQGSNTSSSIPRSNKLLSQALDILES